VQQEQQEKLVISAAVERGERLGKGGWSGVFYVKKGKVWRGEVFGCIFLGDRLGRLLSSS